MDFVIKKAIRSLVFALLAVGQANAEEWTFLYEAGTSSEEATICNFWSANIFAPGEEPSCEIGTLFSVDLENRFIRFQSEESMPDPRQTRESVQRDLFGNLHGAGFTRLEDLRNIMFDQRSQKYTLQLKKLEREEAERTHAAYIGAFHDARTLTDIRIFEEKYRDNDPDMLIPRLAPAKDRLTYQQYQIDYSSATTSAQLENFISKYDDYDPDKFVNDAKRRVVEVRKLERNKLQQIENERQQNERQEKLAEKSAAFERDRSRTRYIQKLRATYATDIVAQNPEALRIVSNFKIDCAAHDGRKLPLLNALYASLDRFSKSRLRTTVRLQSRGREVKIYFDQYDNGRLLGEWLHYQINAWGELQTVGFSIEAVRNACYGTYGTIWLMPGEPGY